MAVLKCKMCGAPLEAVAGTEIIECKYCLTQQTIEGAVDQSKPMMYERGEMLLNDGYFEKAEGYFEKALDLNYKSSDAYLGLEMARCKVKTIEDLAKHYAKLNKEESPELHHAKEFAKDKSWIEKFNAEIENANQKAKVNLQELYDMRKKTAPFKNLVCAGEHHISALKSDGSVLVVRNNKYVKFNTQDWTDIVSIASSPYHIVGLKKDGTVLATGDNHFGECNVENWTNIVAIYTDGPATIGLKDDGTIVATESCTESSWTNIKSLSIGDGGYTIGLKNDGTTIAHYFNRDTRTESDVVSWCNIIEAHATEHYCVGLKKDGTAVSYGGFMYPVNVRDFENIVSISAGEFHPIGVKEDGTVIMDGESNRSPNWDNIVYTSCNYYHTLGLRSDKTVLAIGSNKYGECDVEKWQNVIAIFTGKHYSLGLTKDGKLLIAGDISDISGAYDELVKWRLFEDFDNYELEVKERSAERSKEIEEKIRKQQELEHERQLQETTKRRQEEEAKRQEELKKQQELIKSRKASGVCQHCGSKFKGLFTKVCSSCGKKKDY